MKVGVSTPVLVNVDKAQFVRFPTINQSAHAHQEPLAAQEQAVFKWNVLRTLIVPLEGPVCKTNVSMLAALPVFVVPMPCVQC